MKLKSDKPLGKTGLTVPAVVYGTSYLGNLYTALSWDEKLAIMARWFECTYKPLMIDTAGKYGAGLALEMIGKGLADLEINPDDVVISNKLGWYRVPLETEEPTFEPGAWVDLENDAIQTFGYDEIIKCHKQGNELLGGTYTAQVVSVHDPDEYLMAATDEADRKKRYKEILESYRALFDLKKKGEVKAVGIGSKDWTIIRELYKDVKFDWVMFANSFTVYSHPEELLNFMDKLYEDGVGIVNSAVFHGGFLTGGDKFDYQDVDPESEKGKNLFAWRDKFNEVCTRCHVAPGDACLHFGLSHPAIASIALNTSKPHKMNLNVQILLNQIPDEFWSELKKAGLIEEDYKYF
jgi:D-threo-aldose 1-dehydrogenase